MVSFAGHIACVCTCVCMRVGPREGEEVVVEVVMMMATAIENRATAVGVVMVWVVAPSGRVLLLLLLHMKGCRTTSRELA